MFRSRTGFTALEVMVAVVILGLLTAAAVPSLAPLFQQRQMTQAAQQVEQMLRRAQQTAIARDRTVFVRYDLTAETQTLVIGDPCRPDDRNNPNTDIAGNDRFDGLFVEKLNSGIDINTTTFDDGTCPTPGSNPNDLPATTTNLHTVVFDFQGRVRNNNSGRYVRLQNSRANLGNYDIWVLTQLGDVATVRN